MQSANNKMMKMEAVISSEMSENFYQTTWHQTPEDSDCLNIPYIAWMIFPFVPMIIVHYCKFA
jgi:hypothetical protein